MKQNRKWEIPHAVSFTETTSDSAHTRITN